MPQKSQRLIEIDFLRGLAIIGMAIYHTFFILNFFDIYHQQLDKGLWLILARAVQITFLTLIGVSITISKKSVLTQAKRGVNIFALGLLVSITTFLVIPDYYIKFGILHLIGVSIILISPFKKHRIIPSLLGALVFLATPLITSITTLFQPAYLLGVRVPGITAALDYFPLFPWLSIPLIGITIGNILYKNNSPVFFHPIVLRRKLQPIVYIGRHSLLLYLIHVPIILAVVFTLQILATAISHI